MFEFTGLERLFARLSLCRPILWHKCWRFGPSLLNKCILEPLITQVRMFGHDELKSWERYSDVTIRYDCYDTLRNILAKNISMTIIHDQLKLINGNGHEFKETIGRQIVTAILKRDDVEYDKLRCSLHPTVNLSVVSSQPSIVKELP